MKNFCLTLILLSFYGVLLRLVLPKGEKSPLYAPLKFLLSLAIILSIVSPLISLFSGEPSFPQFSISAEEIPKGEELVRERLQERIYESVKEKFPDASFSLTLVCRDDGIPESVLISCPDERKLVSIRDFIKIKYGLETKVK